MAKRVTIPFTRSETIVRSVTVPAFRAGRFDIEDLEQDEQAADSGTSCSDGRAVMILDDENVLSIAVHAFADSYGDPQQITSIKLKIEQPWSLKDHHTEFKHSPEAAADMITWLDMIADRIRFAKQQAQAVIDAK